MIYIDRKYFLYYNYLNFQSKNLPNGATNNLGAFTVALLPWNAGRDSCLDANSANHLRNPFGHELWPVVTVNVALITYICLLACH